MDSYHNHKESMAHAGLVVMFAICGGILSLNNWPPEWIPPFPLLKASHRFSVFLWITLLWLIIHIYVRWQLRYRRAAAVTYNGTLLALAEWVKREPSEKDLTPYYPQKTSFFKGVVTCFDYIIPIRWATPNYPVDMAYLPLWLATKIQEEAKRVGVITSEWLEWAGSLFVFFMNLSLFMSCK
jgi:hypothetical protein